MREVWLLVLDFSLDWFMIFFGAIIRKFLELILLILEIVLKEGFEEGVLLRGGGRALFVKVLLIGGWGIVGAFGCC